MPAVVGGQADGGATEGTRAKSKGRFKQEGLEGKGLGMNTKTNMVRELEMGETML